MVAGLIYVDGETYEFLDSIAERIGTYNVAIQHSFICTASRSIFSFSAGPVDFNVTFLSPVTPHDLLRMSLPLSYLTIEVAPEIFEEHDVRVYTDITGAIASSSRFSMYSN